MGRPWVSVVMNDKQEGRWTSVSTKSGDADPSDPNLWELAAI
jgi:hypothetical protein